MPVVTTATTIVRRVLRKNVEAIAWKRSINSLQKTAILGTSHIIRKVLQFETESLVCCSGEEPGKKPVSKESDNKT